MHLSSLQSAGGSGRSRSHPGGCRKVLRGLRVRGWALDPQGLGQVGASLCTGSAWSPAPGRRRRGEPVPSDALKLVPAWRGAGCESCLSVSPASSASPELCWSVQRAGGFQPYPEMQQSSRSIPFPGLFFLRKENSHPLWHLSAFPGTQTCQQ